MTTTELREAYNRHEAALQKRADEAKEMAEYYRRRAHEHGKANDLDRWNASWRDCNFYQDRYEAIMKKIADI